MPETEIMAPPPALVSLVVGTLGRSDEVAVLFRSLAAQTDRAFEIIVVDQNTDERLAAVIAAARGLGLAITHLRQPEPNLSAARNLGLANARGDCIGFPDDDCWYEPDMIAAVRRAFSDHPGLAGVVARWEELEGDRVTVPYRLDNAAWRRFRGGNAASITLFFATSAIRNAGGFDVRLGAGRWFGCGEETDLVLHMLASGAYLRHEPTARVHHPVSVLPQLSARQLSRQRAYGRGMGALYVKHGLSSWVRVRGVLAPCVFALKQSPRGASLALAAAMSLGRFEGMWRWWRVYGREAGRRSAHDAGRSGAERGEAS